MRIISIALAIFLSLSSLALAKGFTAEEGARWLAANPDAVIIDAANRQSYQLVHIKNALSIPMENLSKEEAAKLYEALPQDKPILIYDRTGILSPRMFHELHEARPDLKEINYIFERPPFDAVPTEGR